MPKALVFRIVRPGEVTADDSDHWEGSCDIVVLETDDDDVHVMRVLHRKQFATMRAACKELAKMVQHAR